jgi:hypothetical protein
MKQKKGVGPSQEKEQSRQRLLWLMQRLHVRIHDRRGGQELGEF